MHCAKETTAADMVRGDPPHSAASMLAFHIGRTLLGACDACGMVLGWRCVDPRWRHSRYTHSTTTATSRTIAPRTNVERPTLARGVETFGAQYVPLGYELSLLSQHPSPFLSLHTGHALGVHPYKLPVVCADGTCDTKMLAVPHVAPASAASKMSACGCAVLPLPSSSVR